MKSLGLMMAMAGMLGALDPMYGMPRRFAAREPSRSFRKKPTVKIENKDIPKGHTLYRESFTCLYAGREYCIMAEFTACNKKGYIKNRHKKTMELEEYLRASTDQERLDLGFVTFERIIEEPKPNGIIIIE